MDINHICQYPSFNLNWNRKLEEKIHFQFQFLIKLNEKKCKKMCFSIPNKPKYGMATISTHLLRDGQERPLSILLETSKCMFTCSMMQFCQVHRVT